MKINETLLLIAFILTINGINHHEVEIKKFFLKQKIEKNRKKLFKICKKLTNPQNTKSQKQTNLSIFCKSNNELNNIS